MQIDNTNSLYGVPNGVFYGQNERTDELNDRIKTRQFSDYPLRPNFDPRPVPTKYSLFPIIDRRKSKEEPIYKLQDHCVPLNFYPGNSRAPPQGYFNNVDSETTLRNQKSYLEKYGTTATYVPSINSDLYKVEIISKPLPYENKHPFLFRTDEFKKDAFSISTIGKDTFNNHTRTQLRNM